MLIDCWIKIFFEEPGEIMANEEIRNEQTLEEQVEQTTAEQQNEEKWARASGWTQFIRHEKTE